MNPDIRRSFDAIFGKSKSPQVHANRSPALSVAAHILPATSNSKFLKYGVPSGAFKTFSELSS